MRNRLPLLSQRLFNVPLAIHPAKAEIIIAALADRLGVVTIHGLSGGLKPRAFWADDDDDWGPPPAPDTGYDLLQDVALVPVHGTLVKALGGVRPYSGMTGYDQIRAAFLCATEDPAVKAIVLDIDSPGGEVAGLFDLTDELFNARGTKPVWAILNEHAYSAAYTIASAADRIIVPRTGGVGSIGVMCCHVDFSKALAGAGLAVTFIQYGARKTDGAPEKPLSDEALQRLQADVDAMGEMLVEVVARNRGVAAARVKATEAGLFMGAAGVAEGLADAVMSPAAAFQGLLESLH